MSSDLSLPASLSDLKLVYRVLHANLRDNLELLDCRFLDELQARLQEQARSEGVDVGDHSAWDAWLGNPNAVPCEDRVRRRETLD